MKGGYTGIPNLTIMASMPQPHPPEKQATNARQQEVRELQMQLKYIEVLHNKDPRNPNLATGDMLGPRAQYNGFQRQAGCRWPFHDRRDNPAFAREDPSVENWQRDMVIPFLTKKISAVQEDRAEPSAGAKH